MRQRSLALVTASALAFTPASLPPRSGGDERVLLARLAELRALSRATTWPATTAAEIGERLNHDPALCTAFLRTRLRFEPYAGLLRGSDGVLAAGGGNSAELCVLLRDMLAPKSGTKLRFAWATLSPELAAQLLAGAATAPPARAAGLAAAAPPTRPAPLAATDDAGAKAADKPGEQLFAPHAATARQELADVYRDLEQVRPHLRGGATDHDAAVAAVRNHVWLQVERDGKWLCFDPAALLPLPGADVSFGDALPVEPHRVAVRVEVERIAKGALQRETLFEKEWPSAQLFGRAIDVVLAPENLALEPMLAKDRKPQALTEQAKGFTSFGCLAGLTGEPLAPGKAFDLTGRTKSPASGAPTVDPFRRLGRGSPTPEPSELAGVFLTFTLRSPGDPRPVVVERALLDRVGAAARLAGKPAIAPAWQGADSPRVRLALIQRQRALVPGGGLGMQRVARAALTAVVERTCLEDAVALRRGTFTGKPGDALAGLPDVPLELCQLSDSALELTAASFAGSGICFLSRPNLLVLGETLDLEAADRLVERTVVDLAVHQLTALGDPAAAAAARTFHGLVASEIEGRVLRGRGSFAAQVLRAAREQKVPLRLLAAAADVAGIEADPDVRATLAAELATGATLLVPEKPVRVDDRARTAWWRLGPGGAVLAAGHDGRGQGSSEGLTVLKEISIPMVKRCMKFVLCFNKAVAGGGGMSDAGAACLSQAIQDIVKDSLDKAIDRFVKDPLTNQVDAARAVMLGEDYEKLYQKAQAAWGRYQQAQAALDDPLGQIPGYSEVAGAARSTVGGGAEIGSAMGGRLYLLLAMGRDIAEYAGKL